MKSYRCQEMQAVRSAVKLAFEHFQDISFVDNGYPHFFKLLHSKVNSLPLRGYFSKKLCDYVIEQTGVVIPPDRLALFEGQIPFILEVTITIQYYHNQILDGKGGVRSPRAIKQNLIKSNLLKDLLYAYIEQTIDQDLQSPILSTVRKIFKYTDIGQYIEKSFNSYDVYTHNDPFEVPFSDAIGNFVDSEVINYMFDQIKMARQVEHTLFLEWYFIRIYLVSASLFQLYTKLLFELLSIKPPDFETLFNDLRLFSSYYGVMLQLVNDNCDWVPEKFQHKTVAKRYDDAFCDLKNNNITLPIFLYLEAGHKGAIFNFLEKPGLILNGELQNLFFQEIIDSGAMKQAIHLGKAVGRKALSYLDPQNAHWAIFEDMVNISNYNRYYYHLFKEMKKSQIKMY